MTNENQRKGKKERRQKRGRGAMGAKFEGKKIFPLYKKVINLCKRNKLSVWPRPSFVVCGSWEGGKADEAHLFKPRASSPKSASRALKTKKNGRAAV
jgi:hypothetical protein